MRARLTRLAPAALAVLLLAGATGCSGDSGGGTTQQQATAGEQSYGGFPGAGSPTAPDVTTTPGKTVMIDPGGQAGGGSGATCVGC